MTSSLPSAKPPSTAIAWANKNELYVEIPGKDGPPYICKYPLTIEGLTSGLNILVSHPSPPSYQPPAVAQTAHPKVSRPNVRFTQTHRDAAADILRKMKII